MTGILDDLEAAVLEGAGISSSVRWGNNAVAVAPDGQGGDSDSSETTQELGVVHVARDDTHRRHVGFRASGLRGGHGRRVDIETIGVVPGVFGHTSCVEGEEVADGVILDIDAGAVDHDEAGDEAGAIA